RHMGFLIPLLVPSHCATTGVGPFTPQDRHQLMRVPTPPPGAQPRDNILAGTAYLREMWDRYGNVAAMLAAYNAGPGRYDEHRSPGRPLPAETRAYVATLAPVLGDMAASDARARRSVPPLDWRDAPLFVLRSNDSRPTAAPSSETQSSDARATVPVRDPADMEPQDGSIFVARASDGGAP
ncbi:hypothetical protein C5748_26375, partial [Phyllobacterium phragmitis]